MGSYGMGQIAADTLMKAQQGDYAGVAVNMPFIVGALKNPVRLPNPIKPVFHGSPYDFKPEPGYPLGRFDLEKVGTGEGAQAYGHGLYFAENPKVAEEYRGYIPNNGTVIKQFDTEAAALKEGEKAVQLTSGKFAALKNGTYVKDLEYEAPKGHGYEVALHATPESFLDWDKPLSGQSDVVRALSNSPQFGYPPDSITGSALIDRLADPVQAWKGSDLIGGRTPEGKVDIANQLREAGIPGIRYLDQASRAEGKGTSNYVVWSPEIIEILRKYGLIAAPTAGAVANAISQPQQSQQQ